MSGRDLMLATWLWFRSGVNLAPIQKGESDCESGSPRTLLTLGHCYFASPMVKMKETPPPLLLEGLPLSLFSSLFSPGCHVFFPRSLWRF